MEAFAHSVGMQRIETLQDMWLAVDGGGTLAWLVFDSPNRPHNVLNSKLVAQAEELMHRIENLIKQKSLKVLLLTSGKSNSFIAGADIVQLYPILKQTQAKQLVQAGQQINNLIESLSIPTIAVINGTCLGGGLEVALSCNYRITISSAELGLPEVKLGLLPGAGGTIRLAQKIGLQAALDLILAGKSVKGIKAKSLSLVDMVVSNPLALFSKAREFAVQCIDKPVPDLIHRSSSWKDWALDKTPLGHLVVAREASKSLDKLTKGQYPAPYLALDSVLYGLVNPLHKALEYEAEAFGKLAITPQSKSLISLYFLMEGAKKPPKSMTQAAPSKEEIAKFKVGVIGAGVMGAQIALLCILRGLPVYMRDISDAAVERGLQRIEQAIANKKRWTEEKKTATLALLKVGTSVTPFSDCTLVIEAAVEVMKLKHKILQEIETIVSPDCVIATNTSSLSITEWAQISTSKHRICGLHFFNPVNKMPLVEVITQPEANDQAVARAYALAGRLGKVPVVCRDAPGFIVNRILAIYLNEATRAVLAWPEAATAVTQIDKALEEFGMPMGPMRLMDEVGLDVAAHVNPVLEQGLGDRFQAASDALNIIATQHPQHLGVKTGKGIYLYDEKNKTKGLNPVVHELFGKARQKHQQEPKLTKQIVVQRCVLSMVQEAVRILTEQVVETPEALDLAMVLGTGFAPFRGGLLSYADTLGVSSCVRILQELEQTYGARFHPVAKLVEMANENKSFFPHRPSMQQTKHLADRLPRSSL